MGRPTHLSDADVEQFGAELDALRDEVMKSLGKDDARYIYREIGRASCRERV